ncbi:hypothetical protein LguiB_025915 [Lonicera macranthoides]
MGQQQSKDELLYQQVKYGNIEGIKALHSDGAGLEWIDQDAKTPLITACMNPELYDVAKTLIDLGANVNAYRPGRFAGTPLHHAAKRGLERIVVLLLSHGANAFVMNDDCQTPLDVARIKGHSNVVRAIEGRICLFSGWLRELYGPGFLELLAPQLLSRKVWVVVVPCGSRDPSKPFRLELAIYTSSQDPQPRMITALWKANMEEPNFNQPDPTVIISNISNIPRRWRRRRGILSSPEERCKPRRVRQSRLKLAPDNERDKQQLQLFCNACKGIPQARQPMFPFNTQGPFAAATAPPTAEDEDLTMAINASLQETPPVLNTNPGSAANTPTSWGHSTDSTSHGFDDAPSVPPPHKGSSSDSELHKGSPSGNPAQHVHSHVNTPIVETTLESSVPSAPHIEDVIIEDGPVHYPSIDLSPIDLSSPTVATAPTARVEEKKDETGASSCVICLDAPVEGACIPCGHMAGCMSCLNEVKGKKWGCPVCRAKIEQVVRLYAV